MMMVASYSHVTAAFWACQQTSLLIYNDLQANRADGTSGDIFWDHPILHVLCMLYSKRANRRGACIQSVYFTQSDGFHA
jgi:hypothetical protein